jgi:hypothetical protein
MKKIYVASSWRNEFQADVVKALREAGHEVYDFKNPEHGQNGFSWSAIDPNWKSWTPAQFKEAISSPIASEGWGFDQRAMEWCNACVLLLPCGSSAHLEAGWCAGKGKATCLYAPALREPELMYRTLATVPASWGCDTFCLTMEEVLRFLNNSIVIPA